ncbi:M20 family metallopeptidase [Salicibibacter cibi]|uniref:Probable succinyl-diaminopimelate desuccinylase n=1 Tax=Salicibibacter cibi TaxID=2743001 RepID=A0A7T6Z8G4_9BACI|nr:M20 family metallopeptidase [Salicibibacter cibi]QQK78871.1 M20 family metallopeptidase [Salicibibacter cibi]
MSVENLREKIRTAIDSDELMDIVRKLISIPSHTGLEEKEKNVAQYLYELFKSEGIDVYLQEVFDGRSNVIATLKGSSNGRSLMLNGHIDTVPPLSMESPFTPIERDGKLYGRGSADMKSGVATMVYALIVLNRLGIELNGELVFAGVIDEESSRSAGTNFIVENGPKTDLAIVGEPTSLHPVVAHKGITYFEVSFTGEAVHSSVPENGANAINAAADFIKRAEEELVPKYKKMNHPYVGAPTVTMNLIQGGSKGNMPYLSDPNFAIAGTVADTCSVYIDIRWTPYQSSDNIQKDVEEIAKFIEKKRPKINVEVKPILPHPAMEIKSDHVLVRSVQSNLRDELKKEKKITGATYWGDSGLLSDLSNIPTLLFGPGDIGCAHSDNEFIDIKHIEPAAIVYALTALEMCGKS